MNLETETYETATVYDALNRPIKLTTPDNGVTKYTYDKGGLLKAVEVENVHSLDSDIVNNIEYDAKGQRTKIQYENGTTTSYEFDAFTFRIRRIRTTRHSDSKELQDLHFWYDSIGNITLQKDLAQQTVYFDGSVAEPHYDYAYDSLYRLIQTEGRELAGNNQAPNHNDSSRLGITPIPIANTDTAKMRRYIQYYEYDEVGNFISMQHTVTGGTGNWTRHYTTANNSNKLITTVVGAGTPENYTYDNRGNIVSGFFHLQSLEYNAENRLEKVVIDSNRTAYYQYDYNGQRVRKIIIDINTNISEIRKYVGEWEIYRKFVSSSLTLERETLHISDDTRRIALIDTRTTGSGSEPAQLLRYQYSNHLQSAILELDDAGAIISYEEYYPYGSTSFQSGRSGAEVSLKRYRYTGKERDEESGLYYHGARYYVPWLARWTAVDALESEYTPWSPYHYVKCNPINDTDSTGMGGDKDLPTTTTNKYGEKQVSQYTTWFADGYTAYSSTHKVIPKNATGVSEGMSELDLYRFTIDRVLNPGERKIQDNKYLDEKYFEVESQIREFVNLKLLVGSMPDTKHYRKLTAEYKEKIILSILNNDNNAQSSLDQIKRSTSFWGKHNFVYEGGQLLAMGLATGIAKATARDVAGKLFSNILKKETTSQTDNYVKLLTEFGEYDATKILYRGTSGSEKAGAQIFFTDDVAAAATYIKNGGQLIEIRVSQFGLKKLELEGRLEILNDLHQGVRHTSYKFTGNELREALMKISQPSK